MLVDLVAGQIPVGMTSMASLVSLEKAGRVRLVGVTSSERSDLFPDVQAVSEVQPGFEAVSNIYLVAPAGTPQDIVQKLNASVNQVMQTQAAKDFFAEQGSLIRLGSSEALGELIEREVKQWGDLIKDAGIGN